MAVNDEIFKNLEVYGGSTINERVYNFLGSLGYTGTVSDRLGQFEEGGRKGWQGLIRAWGQWAPAQLFSQGQQGVWYEPKPIVAGQQVLYQDAAGTTPVTADGDPVGLMLDRSRGLVLGPELVANGTFDTDLSGWDAGVFVWDAGRARDNVAGSGSGLSQNLGMIAGRFYEVKVNFYDVDGGTPSILMGGGSALTAPQGDSFIDAVLAAEGSTITFVGNNATFAVDNISVREIPGNHATQGNSAARPVYRTDGVLHWLQFDGVDDYLLIGDVMPSGAAFNAAAFRSLTQAARVLGAHSNTENGEGSLSLVSGTVRVTYTIGGVFQNLNGSQIEVGGDEVVTGGYNGIDEIFVKRLGESGATSPASGDIVNSNNEWVVGALSPSDSFLTGRIYGVIIASETSGNGYVGDAEKHLAKLAGITP